MYIRTTTVRRGSKTYHYAQIVESYRREDGVPTNRIIASLGSRSDEEIAALKAALKIARNGATPVFPGDNVAKVRVLHSLRYLDLAVLRRAFHSFGLRRLLRESLKKGRAEVSPVEVIEALILQRCVAPDSKLAASRWYPTTALPELQAIEPGQFNNSRVHRALEALEVAEQKLQELLPVQLLGEQGMASAFFLDATDTWFEGLGPPMAAKGTDKNGVYRRRVGIVLLCDHRGYPMRWHTVDGGYHDATSLFDMATEVAKLPWMEAVPLAVDRALGMAGWVSKLDELGICYITCVPASELESCGAPIPWALLKELQDCGENIDCMRPKVLDAGFDHDRQERYVLDLGLFRKNRPKGAKRLSQAQFTLRCLREMESSSEKPSELAQRLNLNRITFHRYRALMPLGPAVRERIDRGDADALGNTQLAQIAAVPLERQNELFDALVSNAKDHYRQARQAHVAGSEPETFSARGALSINLKRLIEDRQADEERLTRIRTRVAEVNRRLNNPRSNRKDSSALAEVDRVIRRQSMGNVCTASMRKTDEGRQVSLNVDPKAWNRRRLSDGLSLVVCHPDVQGTALERVQMYFSKDAVEKDFQSIKSALGLRPVRHRTDEKLRAHVTVCVLALLLTRLVEHQLAGTDHRMTIREIVERLEPARLNLIEDGNCRYYTAAQLDEDAMALLRALGLEQLADCAWIAREVTLRSTDAPKKSRPGRARSRNLEVDTPSSL